MIGMILNLLDGPFALLAGFGAICAIFGCVKCSRFTMRDCPCCKRVLRATGHDAFDDFELMMVVHEALFESQREKQTTIVRVRSGKHHTQTDANSNGIFQQPLHITVEQGTANVIVDLTDYRGHILATLVLDVKEDIRGSKFHHQPEHLYNMRQKAKTIRNPRIKLTLSLENNDDIEKGLLAGVNKDVTNLVQVQLQKARQAAQSGGDISQIQLMKEACAGPLELFQGLGKTQMTYVAIIGPPSSRRWALGIWNDKQEFEGRARPRLEVDLLRIQSVQADPTRHHVFMINYYDDSRMPQVLTFRRTDRARDVWLEIIRVMVQMVHDSHKQKKDVAKSKAGSKRNVVQLA